MCGFKSHLEGFKHFNSTGYQTDRFSEISMDGHGQGDKEGESEQGASQKSDLFVFPDEVRDH